MLESTNAGDLDAVRQHTEKLIRSATDADRPVLVEAPPSSGKTTSAIALANEVETPLTYLSGRTDLYDQAEEECEKYDDVSYEIIPAPQRDCPAFDDEFGTADKVEELYAKGYSGRQIHHQFSEYAECGLSCEYMEKLNRIADDIESIDVLIGHHAHANRQQYLFERLVILDEFNADPFLQPYPNRSSSVIDDPGEIIPAFLSTVAKHDDTFPTDRFQDVADLRQQLTWSQEWSDGIEWFINNGATRSDALELDFLDPSLDYFDSTHAYAPFLTFSLLCMSRVGPGIDVAPPPDGSLDAVWTDAGLSPATKCLRDRNTGEMYKFEVPDLTVAEQVIGLDGTPNLELWNLFAPEQGFEHEQVIQREDFLTYLESAMNMRVIQMGDGDHHYAAGRISETDYHRFAAVNAREESPFALVSTKQALEKYDDRGWLDEFVKRVDATESEQSHADGDSKLFRGYWALNYGNMKSSNDLKKQEIGVVAGTPYPGHGLVKRWGGLCGEPAEAVSDTDTENIEFEGFADKIYEHFVGAQVIQAILRFGRDESVYENDGATVYVSTNTLPDWFEVSEQLQVHGENDKNVGVVLATLGEIAAITDRPGLAAVTAPTLHGHIAADSRLPDISKRTVDLIVEKIRALDTITIRADAGKNKADLIRLTGDVELVRRDSEVVLLTGSHAYVCEPLGDWEPRFQQVTKV